jgi:hypothetical protein
MIITEPFFDGDFFLDIPSNIGFGITEPTLEKQIFGDDTKQYESIYTFYMYILQVDGKINLLYNAKPKGLTNLGGIEHLSHLCILESTDGENFSRPKLKNIRTQDDDNGYNNVLFKGWKAENFPIFYDPNRTLGKQFVSIYRNVRNNAHTAEIITSNNYTNWNNSGKLLFNMDNKIVLKGCQWHNYFDTLSSAFYNPYTKKYMFYTRYNKSAQQRHIQYSSSTDLLNWSNFKEINLEEHDKYNIYVPTITMYPNSPYFISFPPILEQCNYSTFYTSLMFSRNGHDWKPHPTLKLQTLIKSIPPHCFATGIGVLNDKFYIYVMHIRKCKMYCYSVPKDRFFYLYDSSNLNKSTIITSKPLLLVSKNIHFNFKTNRNGFVIIKLLHNKEIVDVGEKLEGNCLNECVRWTLNHKIYENNQNYQIQITFCQASLYSISYDINC